ncbi:hypothetical protein SAMN05421505_11316 [Sinosporangium album]|uniref:SseB protein N-terminal domain-containing protein n=1 Tax=Sinosporangium album TaxID=504805 RepID=A0A1G8AVV3_9ACTN|nr:hypothetical protein [Sinosporangium album]SDH24984.1 hypothetical protein SAMN05421505_11316 [Sinosporangium album]
MSIGNPTLADVLAQHGTPQRLLAALAEWGILIAVRPDRSVVLGTTQAGERVLLGYTGHETYLKHGGTYTLSSCDADTILDIQRVTGVHEIVIDAAGPCAAAVPIVDLQRFVRSTRTGPTPVMSGATPTAYATDAMAAIPRTQQQPAPPPARPSAPPPPAASPAPEARRPLPPSVPWVPAPRPHLSGPMQQVDPGYERCTHPILPALQQAVAMLLSDYPLIHHVWISEARTTSRAPGIMLHVKVNMSAAEDVVRDLHRGVRARLPQLAASEAPILMARIADARSEQRMIEIGAHIVHPTRGY